MNIEFKIDHIDPLGQGVSKIHDKISFIPKTLPGEVGCAQVYQQKKGVIFAICKGLTKTSPLRTSPDCPHFGKCSACHYRHTSYQEELKFKETNLKWILKNIKSAPGVKIFQAPQRNFYRNRVQLHYDLKKKAFGMFSTYQNKIISVPECLLPKNEISAEIKRLYQDNAWYVEAKKQNKNKGHLEIYWHKARLKKTWNCSYARGGFTQVNQEMNEKLQELVFHHAHENVTTTWDLFGGEGNLTCRLNTFRYVMDLYKVTPSNNKAQYLNIDLYDKNALETLLNQNIKYPELIIVDPPRRGFPSLHLWLEKIKPSKFIYISCWPGTLARDLGKIGNYKIEKLYLIDLFPGTFHFETMVYLERNEC
ncbi:MAG: class I SAM-dependent RNA methyltransferase [bacterium]